MKIKILDCTLRDGGYINNWNFDNQQISNIVNALIDAKIDVIECGYLDEHNGKNDNSTLFKETSVVDNLIQPLKIKSQKVVMINLGDFNIDKLPHKTNTEIDGIRLAFHKKDLRKALIFSETIIELGYKLYFQPMVTKNYTDIEFLSMIEEVNKLKIYAFYIVDSFGSMTLKEFQRYIILANNNLNARISLGYHSHNNMQLAFSNAVNMCNQNFDREVIIDSSIYGIGRGAGNLNTELIADYLNDTLCTNYNTLPLLEIIDVFLNSLMNKSPWGFSPAQYLSASLDCHPNYATYLINKNTNHIASIKIILEQIPKENKVSFNKQLIEQLYIDFVTKEKTTVKGNFEIDENNKILLIASGKSVNENKDIITSKINNDNYTSIALNHMPEFETDFYFFTNQKRFDEFKLIVPKNNIIITSNINDDLGVRIVLNFVKLSLFDNNFISNVAIICIHYLVHKNIKSVEIAGLDGYLTSTDNYSYNETSIINDNKELIEQNSILQKALDSMKNQIKINIITPTIFS